LHDILKIRRKGSKIFFSLQIHAEKALAVSSETNRRATTIKLKIDRDHLFLSWFSHSRSARRVRAVTRIETERICVHKWKGKSLWCPRERETVRDRRGQLEREKGSLRKKKTEEIVASSIRLLDAGRWVGSECCSSWRQNGSLMASLPGP